jgi:hypothetical protein
MTFRTTSAESAGALVEFDLELRPLGAPGGAPHRHLMAEHFEFSQGAAFVWIAGQRPRIARAGDVVDVPPFRWHFVLGVSRTRARVSIRPGVRFDELLELWAQIGHGHLRTSGVGHLVALLREHGCLPGAFSGHRAG